MLDEVRLTLAPSQPVMAGSGLSRLGHELRGPLSGIIGLTGLMTRKLAQESVDPRQQSRQLSMMRDSAQEALDTVERVVVLARLEGQTGTVKDLFDCRDGALRAAETVSELARERDRRIRLDVVDRPLLVAGSGDAFRQLVVELLDNAVKYSDHCDIDVTVTAARDNEQAVLEVRDYGPGLTASDLQKVFLPFERGSAAHGRNQPGCGLGLNIMQRIAERFHAPVTACTGPSGTAVTVTFTTSRTGSPANIQGSEQPWP